MIQIAALFFLTLCFVALVNLIANQRGPGKPERCIDARLSYQAPAASAPVR